MLDKPLNAKLKRDIEDTRGKIFSVTFVKKDGTVRDMVCRTEVKRHLKGGKSTIAHKPNLVSVYDLKKRAYRVVNVDTIIKFKCGPIEFNKERS